jgi:hypothetical protein
MRNEHPESRVRELFMVSVRFAAGQLSNDTRALALCLAAAVPLECVPYDHTAAARELVDYVQGCRDRPAWAFTPDITPSRVG